MIMSNPKYKPIVVYDLYSVYTNICPVSLTCSIFRALIRCIKWIEEKQMRFNFTHVARTKQKNINKIEVNLLVLNTICASVSSLCEPKCSHPDVACDVSPCGVTSDPEFIWHVIKCYIHLNAGPGWNSISCILVLLESFLQTCMTYTTAECTMNNSWWWTDELSEICIVSCQNKFVKLVHLVSFITKKFLTMQHGHMNVKKKGYTTFSFLR
jgi:hypothetical protein